MRKKCGRVDVVEREVIFDEDRAIGLAHRVDFVDMTARGDINPELDDLIRVYGGSGAGATIQLRGNGPITESGKGKPRRMIASANYVDADELDRIIQKLQDIRKTMKRKGE